MSINDAKVNCSARRPCFIDHLFPTFDFRQVPRRNFLQFLCVAGKGGRSRAGSRERWRENTQGTLRMSMDGMTMEDKCERLEPCGM